MDGQRQESSEKQRGERATGRKELEGEFHDEGGFHTSEMPAAGKRLFCWPQKGAEGAKKDMMKPAHEIFALCDHIRETSFALHRFLRHGHLEKVYENGLASRLQKSGRIVSQQHPIEIRDEDGTALGDYFADLFVEEQLIVELKACRSLADEHVAQLLGYLRSSRIEHGLIINFGSPILEIRKYVLSDRMG